jgi:cytochrome c oxidase subunit 3
MAVAEETLALPGEAAAVEQSRPRGISPLGMALFVAGDLMLLGALVAALYALHAEAFVWPPKGVSLGTYLPSMVAASILMSAVTMQWAVWGIRRNDQRTLIVALAFTMFFAVSTLNAQWYDLAHLKYSVGANAYVTFVYVLVGFHMLHLILGLALLTSALVRSVGAEFDEVDHDTITGTAIFWQFVNFAGLVAFAVLFVKP